MLPAGLAPMLAMLSQPFDDPRYEFELKWDGIRCLAFVDGGTRLQSRNLRDITGIYPDLAGLHDLVRGAPCVVDGEIVCLRDGRPSFPALQRRHNARRPETIQRLARALPAIYVIFDLLYHRGADIMSLPFVQRRTLLEEAVKQRDQFVLSETVSGRGRDYFAAVGRLGLEGVVGKKADSPYLPGRRSRYWAKFKHTHAASFIICGYTESETARGSLGALVLGAFVQGKLAGLGMVGTGFNQAELGMLERELAARATEICPFTGTLLGAKGIRWTRPELCCDVQYLELTEAGTLRHPLWKGLRKDIKPGECIFPPERVFGQADEGSTPAF